MASDWAIDVDGVFQNFNDDLDFLITTSFGTGMPAFTNNLSSLALQPGSIFENQKINQRSLRLQGSIIAEGGEGKSDVHDKRQALIKAVMAYPELINQSVELKTLRYSGATVTKDIQVIFDGGLEDEPIGAGGSGWSQEDITIRFIAPDPLFYATSETTVALDSNDSGTMRLVMGRFDNQWNRMGPPNSSGTYTSVEAITEDDTYVYFGGNFTNFDNIGAADQIVRWHKANETWSALSSLNGTVDDLTMLPNGNLVASGLFTNASGDAQADYLAQWNGSSWSDIGDHGSGASILGSTYVDVDLDGNLWYVGNFTNLDGIVNADRAAYWDGSNWNAASTGPTLTPQCIAIHPITGDVYVSRTTGTSIEYWNGASWQSITPPFAGVHTMVFSEDGTLYAGGSATPWLSSYNGTSWSDFSDLSDDIRALAFDKFGNLYAGGDDGAFTSLLSTSKIGLWNGSEWTRPDIELPVSTYSVNQVLANDNGDLWLGTTIGNGTVEYAGKTTVAYNGTWVSYPYIEMDRSGGTSANILWIRNELTGATIYGNYPIADGETITFELRTQKGVSITSDFHGDIQGQFSSKSDLGQFYLSPQNSAGSNDNDITVFVDSVGSPTITTNLKYKAAYISLD